MKIEGTDVDSFVWNIDHYLFERYTRYHKICLFLIFLVHAHSNAFVRHVYCYRYEYVSYLNGFDWIPDTKHLLPEGVIIMDMSCTYFSTLTWSVAHMLAIMDCGNMNMVSVRSTYYTAVRSMVVWLGLCPVCFRYFLYLYWNKSIIYMTYLNVLNF